MEKLIKPVSGYLVLLLALAGVAIGVYLMANGVPRETPQPDFWIGVL